MVEGKEPVPRRVVVVAPMPPEQSAYALARYSRSPDSIRSSLEWVASHSAEKFLDSFYFQYGHASIADLGHCVFCFEGISELAAIEIEDEQLWDGQARSTRYQDFSQGGIVVPDELRDPGARQAYLEAAQAQLAAYLELHRELVGPLSEANPKPPRMGAGRYRRTIDARAFDIARYLLFAGVSTNVGQVTSIRTLEKQMRRMGASAYGEVRSLAVEMHDACAAPPACGLDAAPATAPLAPTLAKYADPDWEQARALERVAAWARQNFAPGSCPELPAVDLIRPRDSLDEIVASWIYAATDHPFRAILDHVSAWSRARKAEVLDVALTGRNPRDELQRPFRGGYGYVFDIVCDIGAYRDMHRHRRCQQIRQAFSAKLGCERPQAVDEHGVGPIYDGALAALARERERVRADSEPASHYLLPFAARCRALFKMDFAEAEYIARVRSGVKGHISYRKIAWEIRERILEVEPELGRLMRATPPWEEDALTR